MTSQQLVARLTDSEPAIVCAYCPGFNPRDKSNRNASHGICSTCLAREMAKLDALEAK